ncbi:MAG: histidinol dehydrogenase [Chitinophagaceae bacterium]|nr:histidinol dehydrogenase [Chitinophagaceae bacterium]
MNIILHPPRQQWNSLTERPVLDYSMLEQSVGQILAEVKQNGDTALRTLAKKFDGVDLHAIKVDDKEMEEAGMLLADELKEAILRAKANIYNFHITQYREEERVETMPGVVCWRRMTGIDKVGLYIPGGSAPLFSTVLMLGIPAVIAGCREIVLCSPPGKEGKIHPAILYAAKVAGITQVFKTGGAQAIAAMAYGTATIPAVYKIFGPGNQYVTCAKQLVQRSGVAIDMPAGPSEVCVLADATAVPAYVAADLLSQAEHGADSQVLLVTADKAMAEKIVEKVGEQLEMLSRKEIAKKALTNSRAIVVGDLNEAIELINAYAPEHLIVSCEDDEKIGNRITNAGSVFLGNYSPESVGDYASGTNHTLPTNGYARAYSGVSVDSFVKKITYQKLTQQGLHQIAGTVMNMAHAEGLDAHAHAVRVRMGL